MEEKNRKSTKGAYASLTGIQRAVPIILFAIAVFIGVCFITPDNVGLGQYVGGFLLGVLGIGGYLVPFFLALHAIFYPRDVIKKGVLGRCIFSLVAMIAFAAMLYAVKSWNTDPLLFEPKEYYIDGQNRSGGGWIGGIIGYALLNVLGKVGLIIFAGLIIALYLTYFFANGRATLAKILLAVLDKISDFFTKRKTKKDAKKEAKRLKYEDKHHPRISQKHESLYEDEFFAVDSGMSEIRIDELGIRETRSQADLEKMPHLEEKVVHNDGENTDNESSIFVDEYEAEEAPEDIVIETVEEPVNEVREEAESVFAQDFDPFDFDANAELAARQAQRTREATTRFNEYTEPVRRFSEEELRAARERDDLERRRRAMQEAEERRRALEEEEERRQRLREILNEPEPDRKAVYTSYTSTVQDRPVRDPEQSDDFPSPIREASAEELRTISQSTATFQETVQRPEVRSYEQPVTRPEVRSYEQPVTRPEARSYEQPAARPEVRSYEQPVTRPEARPYEPVPGTGRYEPTPSAAKEPSTNEFKPYTVPEYTAERREEPEDVLKISREPVIDYNNIDFDDEDEEITAVPEGDEDSDFGEPIPPEEQNPDVARYREMFTVFGDEKPEVHSTVVVTNEEPMEDERTLYSEDTPPFDMPTASPVPASPAPEEKKPEGPDYSSYKLPPLDLLKKPSGEVDPNINEEIERNGEKLIDTLAQFNVKASIRSVDIGPRITRYEIVPAKGVRVNSVINLFDDIALNLAAEGIRMEAPIPGKSAIGVEIPNKKSQMVLLRELLETDEFKNATSTTMACFGKDVTGNPVLGDIAKMPHMLIAGATGMGKSVCINAIILSMLFRSRPDELKFIMIDPKMVEFNSYNGIPHLLIPVIIDVKQAAGALMWAVEQMEKRYEMFLKYAVKNLDGYNQKLREIGEKPLPKIVIIIDELADLMLQARKPVEDLIMRIAQKARAAGIHLIIGTQRPSVDIITGVIKANIPSRISCKVSSFQDSKTILEQGGAEKLLNNGDMLFWPVGKPKPTRVQGAFVSDSEVENVMACLKKQNKGGSYDEQALAEINSAAQKCVKGGKGGSDDYSDSDGGDDTGGGGYYNDPQFLEALNICVNQGKISTSLLQRKLGIGYSKAAKFIDIMQEQGFVSEPNGQKAREVLITRDELHEILARRSLD